MDARTLEALKGSIQKWENIVAGTDADRGAENCALCAMFADNMDDEGGECEGCPVKKAVRASGCTRTPYFDYSHVTQWSENGQYRVPRQGLEDAARVAAQSELAFLRSLLPPEEASNGSNPTI